MYVCMYVCVPEERLTVEDDFTIDIKAGFFKQCYYLTAREFCEVKRNVGTYVCGYMYVFMDID